jgi:K+ transporter
VAVYGVMWIWHRGTSAIRARVIADEVPLKKFIEPLARMTLHAFQVLRSS